MGKKTENQLEKMPIEDILKSIGISVRVKEDLRYIFNTDDEQTEELLDKFYGGLKEKRLQYSIQGREDSDAVFVEFLIEFIKENQKYISRAKLVMITLENYLSNLQHSKLMSNVRKEYTDNLTTKIAKAREMLIGCNKIIPREVSRPDNTLVIDVLSAKELATGEKDNTNQRKLEELKQKGISIVDLLDSIYTQDLLFLGKDRKFGFLLLAHSYNNYAVKNGFKLEDVDFSNVEAFESSFPKEKFLPEMAKLVEDNIEYIDIDKLALCSAYRYIEYLEHIVPDGQELSRRLQSIAEYLKDKDVEFSETIEQKIFKEGEERKKARINFSTRKLLAYIEKIDDKGVYWGPTKIHETIGELMLGEVTLDMLGGATLRRLNLNEEQKNFLAVVSDENYLYLLRNGLIGLEDAKEVNSIKKEVTSECLSELVRIGLTGKDIFEMYIQGGVKKEAISRLGNKNELFSNNRDEIFNMYLETMNSRYLEAMWNLDIATTQDFEGIMDGQEWLQEYQNEKISAHFINYLRENELITPVEIEKYKKQVMMGYAAGQYDKITQALLAYNLNVLSGNKTIEIITGMKTSQEEVFSECERGIVSGIKIAALKYESILAEHEVLTPEQFYELRKKGIVTNEEDKKALDQMPLEKKIRILYGKGYRIAPNVKSILEAKYGSKRTKKNEIKDPSVPGNQNIIEPLKRYELLELLGSEEPIVSQDSGFNGYQVYILPKLNVAILERLYREKKDGSIAEAYGDATYVCEIDKLVQVCSQSKKEIKQFMNVEGNNNGEVKIINHTPGWGMNLINAIKKVNPKIRVKKGQEGKIVAITVGEETVFSSDINKDNLQMINDIITDMRKGKLNLTVEGNR